MDRPIVNAGELPRLEDFMGFAKGVLYALGYLGQGVLGTNTCVGGLIAAPTAPASLNVTIGVGSIYAMETVDPNAYGALGTDTNTILKQGLLESVATLTITPPSTSGYSQIYLVEAAYNDVDENPIVLPYYNSTNPAQPLSGPNNSGTAQNTVRAGNCVIALKAGAAAPTGSQQPPVPDAGYVGLYLITVSNGQTTITSASITQYPGAPFIPINLNQVPTAIQEQVGNWAQDTGSANTLQITLPAGTTLTAGMPIRIKKSNVANTGGVNLVVTAGVTALSPVSVIWEDGTAFVANDWPANAVGDGIYDGSVVRMSGPSGPSIWGNHSNTASTYTGLVTNYPSIMPARNVLLNVTAHSSGSVTVPANVTEIYYEVMGPGGGGAGGAGTASWAGGGGGSGGLAKGWLQVTPGDTINWLCGQGGVGCASGSGVTGSSGTTSSITHGATTIQGTSGTGGQAGPSSCAGGQPGVGINGQINYYGANGGDGNNLNASCQGGQGGASAYGGGGRTSTITLSVMNGVAPGSGGGGGWGTSSTPVTGGTGADGGILLMY